MNIDFVFSWVLRNFKSGKEQSFLKKTCQILHVHVHVYMYIENSCHQFRSLNYYGTEIDF